MKKLISNNDEQYYAYLYKLINAIATISPNYNWLITNFEAYPQKKNYQKLLTKHNYLILSTEKFLEMLKNDDFQWIWGTFSAIPSKYSDNKILDNLSTITSNDNVEIQHQLAEIEIGVVDSSSIYIISSNKYIEIFREVYPNAR